MLRRVLFTMAARACLLGLAIMQLLIPNMQPAAVNRP